MNDTRQTDRRKKQPASRGAEILRFVVTGGLSFVVELVFLIFFRDTVGLNTLLATSLAFLISLAVNYLLCVRWVFPAAGAQKRSAQAAFLLSGVIGLLLNDGLMWLFGRLFGEDGIVLTVFGFTVTMYMINKVLATVLVMVWNYITKRLILTRGGTAKNPAEPPAGKG